MICKIILGLMLILIVGLPAAQAEKIDGQEFFKGFQQDMAPFQDFSQALIVYYQTHQRWPTNNDLNEFLQTAKAASPQMDFDKYASIEFEEKSDGKLKVRYSLKSDPSKTSTLTVSPPYRKM